MPICNLLKNHLYVDISGNYATCCRAAPNAFQQNIKFISHKEYLRSSYRKSINEIMDSGQWHDNCTRCKQEEDAGFKSMREGMKSLMSGIDGRLEFIELNSSTTCNLACKMCNNLVSSKWQSVYDKNKIELRSLGFSDNPTAIFTVGDTLRDIDLTYLRKIRLCSGEPFLNNDIEIIIDVLTEKGILQNVSFEVTTNCTFFPTKLVERLLEFKNVDLFLSFDGIGDLCNYIRTGVEWKTVYPVISKWKEFAENNKQINMSFKHTMQAYNVHQFDKVMDFAKDMDIKIVRSLLTGPVYLSHNALPKEYIDQLKQNGSLVNTELISRLDQIVFSEENFKALKHFTQKMDIVLGTDITATIPALASFMKT